MQNLDQNQLGMVLSQDGGQFVYTALELYKSVLDQGILVIFNNLYTLYEKVYVNIFSFTYDMVFTLFSLFNPTDQKFKVYKAWMEKWKRLEKRLM